MHQSVVENTACHVTLQFRDCRCVCAVSFRCRNRTEIIVLICEQKPYQTFAVGDDFRNNKRGPNVVTVGCKGDACPKPPAANQPSFRPTSCLDYLLRGASKCGIYKLYDSKSGNSFPAYCDLKSEPGTAWTLVMSWSVAFRWLPPFTKFPFKNNSPVNENAQNWNLYRLSLARMRSLQAHSTHWRATCSYPTYGIDFRDYLRGNFKDFNIVDFLGDRQCKKVEYINIRGHVGTHLTVPFWQRLNSYTLHTDSTYTHCQFKTMKTGAVSGEDNFGHYRVINSKFRCTQGNQSTTQWWFGAHM